MWADEYKRYLKSKKTYIILVLVLVTVVSFIISLEDKQMFMDQMGSNSPDLNKSALEQLIRNYTGFRFFFDFWFVSDFFLAYLIILFLWVGVFLSSSLEKQREDGFGNFLITRTSYTYYLRSKLIAQSLYISTVVFIASFISLIIAFCIGGFRFDFLSIGFYDLNQIKTILIFLLQVLLIIFYTVLVNGICLMSNFMIKNKYIIQCLPVVAFSLIPMLGASTIGNIIQPLGEVLICFIPGNALKSINYIFQESFSIESYFLCFAPFVVFCICLGVLYWGNKKKFSENYL